jgi:hypothetical protein
MDTLLRRLLRTGLRRGLAGNWAWFVAAACAFVLRRTLNDKGNLVTSLKIRPGEQVLISVRDRTTPALPSVSVATAGDSPGGGAGAADGPES